MPSKRLNLLKSALSDTKKQRKSLLRQLSKTQDASNGNQSSDSSSHGGEQDTTSSLGPYISNSELERIREQNYYKSLQEKKKRKSQLQLQRNQNGKKRRGNGSDADGNGSSTNALDTTAAASTNSSTDTTNLAAAAAIDVPESIPEPLQVMKILRRYKEPITLFGETPLERWSRLKFVEKKYSEMVNEQNTYQKHMREEEDAQRERELLQSARQQSTTQNEDTANDSTSGTVSASNTTTTSSLKTNSENTELDSSALYSTPLPTWDESKMRTKEQYILYMLDRLCDEWRIFLANRPEGEKKRAIGKREYGNWKQTTQYLIPLKNKLKKRKMDRDQLTFFANIFSYAAQREYVLANDQYLQLAIGNAPWPMGVENVGIHARSAREKISSRNVAHVLNDDTQRKYIQSVKRLLTFAQKKYPTIPSKMVV